MGTVSVQPQNYSTTSLGELPCEGANTVRVPLDFDGINDIEVDLSAIQQTGKFSAAQTLFFDNSTNGAVVKIKCGVSNQTFQVPIGGFIYMPLLQPNPPKITFSCTAAVPLTAFFTNFFLPPVVWGPTLGGAAAGIVAPATPNDNSGTIVAGGTPQVQIAANANRIGILISNPDTETETLYIQFGAGNGPIPLLPGMTYESGIVDWLGDILVNAATTGHAVTAYEGT